MIWLRHPDETGVATVATPVLTVAETVLASYHLRLVTTFHNLTEKIHCFDNDLDDRVVEFLKVMAYRQMRNEELPHDAPFYFTGIHPSKDGEEQMEFMLSQGESATYCDIPFRPNYQKLHQAFLKVCPKPLPRGEWVLINSRYLLEITSAKSPAVIKPGLEASEPPAPSPPKPVVFELIDVTSYTSMPAPMQSSDAGEAWVWGDFFAILQKDPILVSQAIHVLAKGSDLGPAAFTYPYALTVFYQKHKNPHGPSSRPVLCATLERADYAAALATMGSSASQIKKFKGQIGPTMLCMFTPEGHLNFGEFEQDVTADAAREAFFTLIAERLSLHGEPIRIGPIAAVYGHPNTGWPADEATEKGDKKSGCLGLLIIPIFVAVLFFVQW